jgi:FkbM family methyltransferase
MNPAMIQSPVSRRQRLANLLRPIFEWAGIAVLSRPALHALDRNLARLLPKRDGWFVEAGANDGFRQSNTYYLARFRGWRGVLIEAVPELAEACRRRRPESAVVQCALGAPEKAGSTVQLRLAGLMTTVRGALGNEAAEQRRAAQGLACQGMPVEERFVEVPVRTLSDVLSQSSVPTDFDLLSLDVEGYEIEVLKGLDLERFRPRAICIEVWREHLDAVRQHLEPHYQLAEVLFENERHGDYLWVRRSPNEPAANVATPERSRPG